ncbi:MAG: ankyrin repeat domain-containing protein [Myxococcales bacterium]|nr:ankyrin repeat domain-containing protein [Myxococcales bacterium]
MKLEWQDAAVRGDAAVLSDLIDRGVDVDSLDRYGQTALMLAARSGHLEAARVLVEAGADLDRTAKYHLSALMLAVINDRTSLVELLVEAGADTEIQGTGAPGFAGRTALDLAEDLGRESVRRLLNR